METLVREVQCWLPKRRKSSSRSATFWCLHQSYFRTSKQKGCLRTNQVHPWAPRWRRLKLELLLSLKNPEPQTELACSRTILSSNRLLR